jgi:hypothetical protein
MTVFNVERDEHASRVARKEIGQRLENIPLKVLDIEDVTDETDDETTDDVDDTADEDTETTAADTDDTASGDETEDDEPLPEFEDLL